jgi:hypothetical protein
MKFRLRTLEAQREQENRRLQGPFVKGFWRPTLATGCSFFSSSPRGRATLNLLSAAVDVVLTEGPNVTEVRMFWSQPTISAAVIVLLGNALIIIAIQLQLQ